MKSERGAAIVETALILPLLLLVAIGIFEFGRAYQTWQVLTNAAREGARVAVLPGTTDAQVTTRVNDYVTAGQLTETATVIVTRNNPLAIGTGMATASRVDVTYPFEFIVLQPVARLVVPATTLGGALPMTTSATMRNES